MIILEIEGEPIPWKAHGGYGRKSFNPRYKEKQWIQWQIRQQYQGKLIDTAIICDCFFYRTIPKSTSHKKRELMLAGRIRPTTRPDRGNYLKFLEDCLTGTVISDDSVIVDGRVPKFYADKGRTTLVIRSLDENIYSDNPYLNIS